jgi:uncharacterized protein (TIGR00255 family)
MISMTGFAARRGSAGGYSWAWDLRSVNGKGLDLRLRLPDWIDGLELALRAELQRAISRGNVTLSLRVTADDANGDAAMRLNRPALISALAALAEVEAQAMAAGVTLRQPTSADVLTLRGIVEGNTQDNDTGPLRLALLADFALLLQDYATMRRAEGAALAAVLRAQVDAIAGLTRDAQAETQARAADQSTALRDGLHRILAETDVIDENRLAQELAMLAVKTDVTEELDRLTAHVAAAKDQLAEAGPVGRRLDFLMQEFMREANTLCSKAQSLRLTRIGLDLKTVIDQMREQVQNVE